MPIYYPSITAPPSCDGHDSERKVLRPSREVPVLFPESGRWTQRWQLFLSLSPARRRTASRCEWVIGVRCLASAAPSLNCGKWFSRLHLMRWLSLDSEKNAEIRRVERRRQRAAKHCRVCRERSQNMENGSFVTFRSK